MKAIILRKSYLTLIEMMIVMTIIMMIIGVLGYNYMGTLEEGKAFKTKAGMERLESILSLAVMEDSKHLDDLESDWPDVVKRSPMVQNPGALINDGWGRKYEVTVDGGEINIRSERYETYIKTHSTMFGKNK